MREKPRCPFAFGGAFSLLDRGLAGYGAKPV